MAKAPLIRNRFSPVPRVQLICSDPSLTHQEFVPECDVNNVILRFAGTGSLPPRLNAREPEFLDVSDIPDNLLDAIEQARSGREFFDALPDQVKAAVDYDPMRLLDAMDELSRLRASQPDVTKPAESSGAGAEPQVS